MQRFLNYETSMDCEIDEAILDSLIASFQAGEISQEDFRKSLISLVATYKYHVTSGDYVRHVHPDLITQFGSRIPGELK